MTLDTRKYALLRDITRQLQLLMASEAIEILAHATAEVMARDPSQFKHLATVFKHALDRDVPHHPAQGRCPSS